MKTIVLLMIILVDQGLNEKVTLSSCRHNGTIELMLTGDNKMYQLKLCSLNSICYTENNIMFKREINRSMSHTDHDRSTHCNECEILYLSETFDHNCSQFVTTCQDSSEFMQTCVATTAKVPNQSLCDTNLPISQGILVALLATFVVLLVVVIIGWMWTCWTMKKKRLRMKINTTNIR